MDASLDKDIKLKFVSVSDIRIQNLMAVNSKVSFVDVENITLDSAQIKETTIEMENAHNIYINNISLIASSIALGKSKNITLLNSYAENSERPFSLVDSENISISNISSLGSSYAVYIYSCNNTMISSGTFKTSKNAVEIYYSKNVKVQNITVYGVSRTPGLRLYKSESVDVEHVALFNASFHVVGYYYYFYGEYSVRSGKYEYGVKFVWRSKYYNVKITNLTVNSLPVLYGYNLTDAVIDGDYGQIILVNAKNIKIRNQHIWGIRDGLYLLLSESIQITNNKFEEIGEGIVVLGSDQIIIEDNTIRNTTSYAIYVLGSKSTKIRYNSFIDTNRTVYFMHARVEITHNYWFDQMHSDLDHDGINDYRYDDVDLDPLYQQNTKPKSMLYTYMATEITYYYVLFFILIFFLRKKLPQILNWLLDIGADESAGTCRTIIVQA